MPHSVRRGDPSLRVFRRKADRHTAQEDCRHSVRRLCYDLFGGCGGLGHALASVGFKVEICDNQSVPQTPGPNMKINICDLGHLGSFIRLRKAIQRGGVAYVGLAVPCGSFNILRIRGGTTSRTKPNLGDWALLQEQTGSFRFTHYSAL